MVQSENRFQFGYRQLFKQGMIKGDLVSDSNERDWMVRPSGSIILIPVLMKVSVASWDQFRYNKDEERPLNHVLWFYGILTLLAFVHNSVKYSVDDSFAAFWYDLCFASWCPSLGQNFKRWGNRFLPRMVRLGLIIMKKLFFGYLGATVAVVFAVWHYANFGSWRLALLWSTWGYLWCFLCF